MGLKKAITRIEKKINESNLLIEEQKIDNDTQSLYTTRAVLYAYKEALKILNDESIAPTKAQLNLIKKAGKYLSSESDIDTLNMVALIKNEYNANGGGVDLIDYIDGVQVAQKFEFTFSPKEFLELINLIK